MRKFWLTNGTETKGLNFEAGVMLFEPQGLGASTVKTFANMNNGFFVKSGNNESQNTITGNLLFRGPDPYDMYQRFINWVLTNEDSLILQYAPNGVDRFNRHVQMQTITKAELTAGHLLEVGVTFYCLDPWYIKQITLNNTVSALGQLPSAFEITLTDVTDPQIILDGAGSLIFADTTATTDVIKLSTLPDDSYITLNGEDAIQRIDIATNPFFRLDAGKSATFRFPNGGTHQIRVVHYWRTV